MSPRPALVLLLALAALAAAPDGRADEHWAPDPPGAPLRSQRALADFAYDVKVTDRNLMGVSITNYGFTGNNFVSASPSMEYPLGSRYEHLVRGGLWVGAHGYNDDATEFFKVTTGAVDGAAGGAPKNSTEFTPFGTQILVRSTLKKDTRFSPNAVSEQDYISEYDDRTPTQAAGNNQPHTPMDIRVRQENYSWSFSDLKHFVVFHFVIKNVGTAPLDSVFTGFYAELATGRGPYHSGWFGKKWVAWDTSDSMFREHYCANSPIPSGCNYTYVPPWVGIKLLGVRDRHDVTNSRLRPEHRISVGAWKYAVGDAARDEDTERYAIMASGARPDTLGPDMIPPPPGGIGGDPVEMIAVGPFMQIDPQDSVSFDIALVGGDDIADIRRHAEKAQRAFDSNYIVPVPPDPPLIKVIARDGALDVYWEDSPESYIDPTSPNPKDFEGYRVYVGENQLAPTLAAEYDAPGDTSRFNTGFGDVTIPSGPDTIDGVPFKYKTTVRGLRNGFKYYVAVTAFDIGTSEFESLESGIPLNLTLAYPGPAPEETRAARRRVTVFPNPYRVEARWDQGRLARDHYLWFTNLPERCTLRIYTLSGDLVFDTVFDGSTYRGEGARGIYYPKRDVGIDAPTLSGTTYGWNMITRQGEAAATGLYLYSVEDRATHKSTVGKFLIIKSDREEF